MKEQAMAFGVTVLKSLGRVYALARYERKEWNDLSHLIHTYSIHSTQRQSPRTQWPPGHPSGRVFGADCRR